MLFAETFSKLFLLEFGAKYFILINIILGRHSITVNQEVDNITQIADSINHDDGSINEVKESNDDKDDSTVDNRKIKLSKKIVGYN